MIDWRVVPIQKWPGEQHKERKSARFTKGVEFTTFSGERRTRRQQGVDWSETTRLLERELSHLRARNVLLQMAVTEAEIRNDGWIRANARPSHPGVIITFHSDLLKIPLSYPCDTFDDWQANVRAIAKSLEWLRGVDRYGVTKRGEQYTGFKGLPSGQQHQNELVQRGLELIRQHGSSKAALFATHPDHGGSPEDFHAVQAARGREA